MNSHHRFPRTFLRGVAMMEKMNVRPKTCVDAKRTLDEV